MRIRLAGVCKHHGARTVLDDVTLSVTPESRVGVVGPNGVGKSTLLRLIAGLETPDAGTVSSVPGSLTCGYLPQEPDASGGETLRAYLARRTGVAAAGRELEREATRLAGEGGDPDAYAAALDRFLALGGGDLEAPARSVCAELGLAVELARPTTALSNGKERGPHSQRSSSRASMCCFSTSRRTTSTSKGSSGWNASWSRRRAATSWSRTIASCWTGR